VLSAGWITNQNSRLLDREILEEEIESTEGSGSMGSTWHRTADVELPSLLDAFHDFEAPIRFDSRNNIHLDSRVVRSPLCSRAKGNQPG
jgi:hypothetical protein